MNSQYGFFFDQGRCISCRTCSVACKTWHGLPPGPLKYLRVYEYEKGSFPNVRIHLQWIPCYHCEEPACISECPTDAIHKDARYGAVRIDPDACIGCGVCYDACPYGAVVFEDKADGEKKARKCDMCIDRLVRGENPICVMSCPTQALDFGSLSSLIERYGDKRDLTDMPDSRITKPAIIFKSHAEKRHIVPYDAERALELLMNRDPLPRIFDSPTDVTEIPEGMVGRGELVIKHPSGEDLMRHTRNDEG